MISQPLFRKKILAWLIGLGLVSFLIVTALSILVDDPRFMGTHGADSFSASALGHKAFANTLKRTGWNVLQSQNRTLEKLTPSSALFVLEPGVDPERLPDLAKMLQADTVLLVLPKRNGFPSPFKRRWIGLATRTGEERIETILNHVPGPDFTGTNGEIVLESKSTAWHGQGFAAKPNLAEPQVINWGRLTPLVYNGEGVLLGKVEGVPNDIYVLSDPDILQNHGLDEPGNAAFAFELVKLVAGGDETIVFDETSHGHILSPNFLKSAFSPPFLYPVTLFLLAVAALVLSAAARFAAPEEEAAAFSKSKLPLIRNISDLLKFGGHFGTVTERYYRDILKDVAEKLYAPAGLHDMALIEWVDEIAERRNVKTKYYDIRHRAFVGITREGLNASRQTKLAHDAYQWRKEVLYGTGKDKETE